MGVGVCVRVCERESHQPEYEKKGKNSKQRLALLTNHSPHFPSSIISQKGNVKSDFLADKNAFLTLTSKKTDSVHS